MARKPLIFQRLSLLFLICSSCAWVGSGAASGPGPVPVGPREVVGGAGRAGPLWRRGIGIPGEVEGLEGRHPYPLPVSPPAVEPADGVQDGCHAMITPPPSILKRQDQGQIQALSNQLQQLSEQSRSVSQSSQQLSQSLQQATQRLSQTEQQLASVRLQQNAAESASRSMSQASAEASRRADEARASADRAVSEVIRSASQSASRALSENMASVTSSMSASFASAIRLASQSAVDAMMSAASVARQAQADATAFRNEANTQIQQAQGAALSVTQTALAVVGGIIGSSLLTGVGFILFLRHRRKKRQQLRRGDGSIANIGYPQPTGTSNKAYSVSSVNKGYATSDDSSSTYSTDDTGFKFPAGTDDITQPAPAATSAMSATSGTEIPRKSVTRGVGYAVSYYGPPASMSATTGGVSSNTGNAGARNLSTNSRAGTNNTSNKQAPFQLGNPPPPRGVGAAAGLAAGKFTLFPAARLKFQPNLKPTNQQIKNQNQQNQQQQQQPTSASPPPSSSAGGARVGAGLSGPAAPGNGTDDTDRVSRGEVPSLDKWLREGTDVSPFSTLRGQQQGQQGR